MSTPHTLVFPDWIHLTSMRSQRSGKYFMIGLATVRGIGRIDVCATASAWSLLFPASVDGSAWTVLILCRSRGVRPTHHRNLWSLDFLPPRGPWAHFLRSWRVQGGGRAAWCGAWVRGGGRGAFLPLRQRWEERGSTFGSWWMGFILSVADGGFLLREC